ncbi:MAG: hypothetical protein NUV74_06980 [Candidatus Brocadiaceae bacterium]|nr:hypothetical protein [Candidatus Brocadiaceae bacterium]
MGKKPINPYLLHKFIITKGVVFCFSTVIIDKPLVFVKPIFGVIGFLSCPATELELS